MARGYEIDPKSMSFLDHLGELRKVLIQSLVAIVLFAAAAWAFSGTLLDRLIETLQLENVQFLSPMEPFQARLRIALSVGLAVSLPFVSLRVWSFVVPALQSKERRVIVPSAIATVGLFAGGAAFSLGVLTPLMLGLLLEFGTEHARADLALDPVLAFVFRMTLACAVLFQLPLVLAVTTFLGVTTPRSLLRTWRHAVVVIFILAAVVTPGDGPSQVILAVPLVFLYFASILVSWIIWRSRPVEGAAPSEGEEKPPPRTPPEGTAARGEGEKPGEGR